MLNTLSLKVQIPFLLVVTLLAGCGEVVVFGHTVREGQAKAEVKAEAPVAATNTTSASSTTSASTKVAARPVVYVKTITISIASQAAEKLAKDSRFNADMLLNVIKRELQSRKMLDTNASSTGSIVEISIDNYELHPTTNFAIFGYIPNTGTLTANLVSHDENGRLRSHVEAHAKVSVPAAGEVDMLQPLYHEFAITIADTLAGVRAKSDAEHDQSSR